MFGSKKNDQTKNTMPEVAHDITVIPDIFYGGNDPDIYVEKNVVKQDTGAPSVQPEQKPKEPVVPEKKEVSTRPLPTRRLPPPPLPVPETVPYPEPAPAVSNAPQMVTPAVSPKKNHFAFIGVVIVVLAGAAGASWYFYFRTASAPSQKVPVVSNTGDTISEPTPVPSVTPAVTSSTVATSTIPEPPTPTSTVQKERSLPIFSLIVPPDTDSDKLSGPEEEIFGTDPETLDSDTDGYYDGQEVYNLYNPKGIAPMRIIDSGLVSEYINPNFQYRVYYPISWQVSPIDARTNSEVLFNNASGDYIEVKAYAKLPGETFPGWFGRVVNDQKYTDIVAQTNRFQVPYFRRKDGLVHYFDTANTVYIVILYSHNDTTNDYPHVIDMMAQSFRPGKVTATLPEQPRVPVPGVSSTPSVNSVSSTLNSSSVSVTSSQR